MAKEKKLKLSERVHPLYEDNSDRWDFFHNSVFGGDYIINEDNLFSHRLEDSSDYSDRLERAYFLNFCDAVPTIYNSYIFREDIERPPDEVLEYFRTNVDSCNTPISAFVKRAGYFASIYGAIHALVDIKAISRKDISKRDVRNGIVTPYTTLIFPMQLVDWSIDQYGNWRWVIIKTTYYRDEDPYTERVEEFHYRLITRDEWKVEDEDGKLVNFPNGEPNSGKNELGIVPLATMYHKDINDDKIGESLIKDITYVNRAILNWCSCIDEQIDRQTFSQLVIPDDGAMSEEDEAGEDPLTRVGTSSILTFPANAGHPPQFISPSTENITAIWRLVIDHIKEIYRMGGLLGGTGDLYVSKSGRAAQAGFMGVNSALAEKASSYQKFENDISRLAYLQLGENVEEYELAKYPSSFDIGALSTEIDSYLKVMERNFSPTLNKTIQKNIARRAVPLASQAVRKEIEDEIDAGISIVEKTGEEKVDRTGEDGNPNIQNLSDTHRSIQDKEDDEMKKQKKEE